MKNFSGKDKKRPIKNYWSSSNTSNTSINLGGMDSYVYIQCGFSDAKS